MVLDLISMLVVLQRPQMLKAVSLRQPELLARRMVFEGLREVVQIVFGDVARAVAMSSAPPHFLFLMQPLQILLLPKHVHLLRP